MSCACFPELHVRSRFFPQIVISTQGNSLCSPCQPGLCAACQAPLKTWRHGSRNAWRMQQLASASQNVKLSCTVSGGTFPNGSGKISEHLFWKLISSLIQCALAFAMHVHRQVSCPVNIVRGVSESAVASCGRCTHVQVFQNGYHMLSWIEWRSSWQHLTIQTSSVIVMAAVLKPPGALTKIQERPNSFGDLAVLKEESCQGNVPELF